MDHNQIPELPDEEAAVSASPEAQLPQEYEPSAREIPLEEAMVEEVLISYEDSKEEESEIFSQEPVQAESLISAVEMAMEEFAREEEMIAQIVPEESVADLAAESVQDDSAASNMDVSEPQSAPLQSRVNTPKADDEELDLKLLKETLLAGTSEPEAPQEEVNDQEYRDNGMDFDALYAAPAPTPAPEETAFPIQPPRKGRPKRKKGEGLLGIPNILATVVWIALIVMIGVTLGRMLWVCAADVLAFGREDKAVTITIYEADTMEDIVEKLHKNGLIRYKSLFNLYADISDAEEDIQPGIYDLNTRYDYHALVNFMSPRSSREVVEGVLIPEGYSCVQIFQLLEENKICTAQDIAAYAASGDLGDYWFLEGVERGSENCLEGFLFPDTYDFYKNSSPKEVLTKLLNNFENKFDEEMQNQLVVLNDSLTGDYTVRDIVIVASLIEKESAAPGESPNIAGVIYNRLFNWQYPAFLNIDAAIVYAQGGNAENIDTKLDSPYNTYTNIGLTPGPISNPGLSSLKAALNPESHNYYFYVLNPSTGMHQFSTTEAEHNAYVAQFYN